MQFHWTAPAGNTKRSELLKYLTNAERRQCGSVDVALMGYK